ncbi:MAG: hypothetical protein J4428_02780 [Candidatus Aenigmarchaeota archaeon]|nr:hypothetical protein [Candidatus Aenigmarchaeota archaeon]
MLNWKTATLWALILWSLTFTVNSIIGFIPLLEDSDLIKLVLSASILPLLVLLCTRMYFREGYKTNGLLLGLYFVILNSLLDLTILVPLFSKSVNYFWDYPYLISIVEILIFSTLSGFWNSKKEVSMSGIINSPVSMS